MNPTPPFLDQFVVHQSPIQTGQRETEQREEDRKGAVVLSFINSWVFAPRPQQETQDWTFHNRIQLNDLTSSKTHRFQYMVTEFICPGDTPFAELPQYKHGRPFRELRLIMPAFAGPPLEQAMQGIGFAPGERWVTSEDHTASCYTLKVTNDWTAHEKIQLRDHPLLKHYHQIGFDTDTPISNFLNTPRVSPLSPS